MTEPTDLLVEKQRISSIDLMRGIVMVVMALDHTRDFFHISAFVFDPADPTRTTPVLFFTRWITHYCAPTFVFLSGTSIRLSLQRKSKKELSRFLWTRGLWLLLLEFTVVRFSFFFNLFYDATIVQVIYTIGTSMIIMAALIHLKTKVLLMLGIVITLGHNALDTIRLTPDHPLFYWWTFIYQAGFIEIAPGKFFLVNYPFLPWLGVMLLGYCLGEWYSKGFDPSKRKKWLLVTGVSATVLFIFLRTLNGYGDPAPWQSQKNELYTLLSFLNTTKYPISLLYILMTLGPVLILLSWMETFRIAKLKPIEVFGRVPMFYYLFHFFLIHTMAIFTFMLVRHKDFSDLNFHYIISGKLTGYFGGVPYSAGYSLPWVYLAWITVILICYPLCRRYNDYKSTHKQWWLSYL